MTMPQESAAGLAAALDAGKTALAAGDLAAALAHFETIIASAPADPDGYGNLGAIYAGLGDVERSESCYDAIIAANPGHTDALYNRGVVRMNAERFDAAHDDFAAVCALLPDDPDARNNLAVSAFMRGHFAEARAELERVLAGDPDHVNAVLNFCDVAEAMGDETAAVAACDAFLARGDHDEIRRRRIDLGVAASSRALAASRDLKAAAATG